MNNEINECINKFNEEKIENQNNFSDKRNNKLKGILNVVNIVNNHNAQNINYSFPIKSPKHYYSSKKNFLFNSLRASLKSKGAKGNNSNRKEKELSNFNNLKKVKTHNNDTESVNIKKDIFHGGNINLKSRNNLNIGIKREDSNKSDVFNFIEFANDLYKNDEHLKKSIIKRCESNQYIHKRNKINSGRNNDIFKKKKLIITFGLNDENNNISNTNSKIQNNSKNTHLKRRISCINREISNDFYNKDKITFSNFLNLKSNINPKEFGDETNCNNKENNEKGNAVKLSKFGLANQKKSKTKKSQKKGMSSKKISEENKEEKIKPKSSAKIKVRKSNNKENETQINEVDIIENTKKKKKKHYCFLCCLTNKLNDSDEF